MAQGSQTDNSSSMGRVSIRESLSDTKCSGIIGVPITFLDKYNPEQFEIIGRADANIKDDAPECYIRGFKDKGGAPLVQGKFVYKRILIKRR